MSGSLASSGKALRSKTKEHRECRVDCRMPGLGRLGGEPDGNNVYETKEP